MKTFYLFHLGLGNVGQELANEIIKQVDFLRDNYLLNLKYCGLFNSKVGYYDREGYKKEQLINILNRIKNNKKNERTNDEILNIISEIHQPFILIDTTASDKTLPIIFSSLARGGYAVISNKKPLSMQQEQYDLLHQLGNERLFYETTVGAALPVISVLKTFLDTGDEILEINGCFSGTLGFICSSLENGESFSESVTNAKKLGFTEPDPRDDLSGKDVGRKALILARMLGQKIEMENIQLQAMYPDSYNKYSVGEFMTNIRNLDQEFMNKFQQASKKGNTFRYVAKITQNSVKVALTEVSKNSDLGSLKGPDNIVVFKTSRYLNNPLVIKGPGAGAEVTASGVFGDILAIARIV